MCVIIQKPAGKKIEEADLMSAAKVNSDGFGYMYYDSGSGRIFARKHLITDAKEIVKIVSELEGKEVALHFRIKTHGKIVAQQCHPFKILDKKRNGMDMYLMHNGTISDVPALDGESDTQAFVRTFMIPVLSANPKLIESEIFKAVVEKFIGYSKLLVMYGDGKIVRFNERQWDEHDGMKVSNKNFVKTSLPYTGNYGHMGYDENSYYSNYKKKKEEEIVGSFEVCGLQCTVGTNVVVADSEDKDFLVEGTITNYDNNNVHVKFSDGNHEAIVAFYPLSGYSCTNVGAYRNKYIVPSGPALSQKALVHYKSTDKKKDLTFSNLSHVMQKKELNVCCEFRWTGLFLADSTCDYGGITIADVAKKTEQERFTWFMENLDEGFGMFQDLVEKAVLEDEEFSSEKEFY